MVAVWSGFLVWSAALSVSVLAAPTVVDGPVRYVGIVNNGVTESFLGIKFGQDTGGTNRFKRPRPYAYPAGATVQATAPGPACAQKLGNPVPSVSDLLSNVTDISEDCLHIRVDRPHNTSARAKLPVMVYLYGGGYNIGQIYDVAYDPFGLVRNSAAKGMPVVYAAINYRVGIFGFNLLPALREEQNLNVGLEDQRLGLEWIQRHIAAFGGDPDNVTIFGEDSGWSNVAYQLMAYGGTIAPTFRRAILQSGPTPGGNMAAGNTTARNVAKVVAAVNCSSPSGDSGRSADELACLRALPLNTLLNAAVEVEYTFDAFGGFGTFRPTAPSRFLPAAPSTLLRTGRFIKGIDIMTGWNEDDGTVFVPPTFLTNDSTFQAWAAYEFPTLSPGNLAELISLYPEAEFTDDTSSSEHHPVIHIDRNFFRAARVVRDAHFACPTLYLHAAVARFNHNNSPKNKNGPALYLWAVNQTVLETRHALAGTLFERVDHYADVAYAFASVDRPPLWPYVAPVDYDLASQVSGSWAAFAHFGRPTTVAVAAPRTRSLQQQQEQDQGQNQGQGQVGNVTVAPWEDSVSCCGGGRGAGRPALLRIIGGPREGMASVYEGENAVKAVPLYGEKLADRCGFWNRPDVLAQLGV